MYLKRDMILADSFFTRGVVASAARLGYQIDKANNLNSTVVTMILSLMK